LQWWRAIGEARLYEDIDYGQWGLVVHDPSRAGRETDGAFDDREEDFREGVS
jgi:hypothetical protein